MTTLWIYSSSLGPGYFELELEGVLGCSHPVIITWIPTPAMIWTFDTWIPSLPSIFVRRFLSAV